MVPKINADEHNSLNEPHVLSKSIPPTGGDDVVLDVLIDIKHYTCNNFRLGEGEVPTFMHG